HDPDTLVGEEGREAFERRLEAALPLSEYLVRELSGHRIWRTADGRCSAGRGGPAADRPRFPPEYTGNLLIARIAEVVGCRPRGSLSFG
ncbi:hypothetical protein B1A_12398, partial [mine drainage metagenome]